MKGRIGKYKDKIVVWGDPNLTAKNEINIDSLGGGEGQVDIPIEYYKVVAPEGENLDECRDYVYSFFIDVLSSVSTYSIFVKGTSTSSSANLYTITVGSSVRLSFNQSSFLFLSICQTSLLSSTSSVKYKKPFTA